ncbi:MAG: agmatine deiminase family protein [Bacteroidota bacterium]
MTKFLLSLTISVCLFSCNRSVEQNSKTIRIPGEFEPQEALWLGFETVQSSRRKDTVSIKMIQAIHPFVKLNLIIEHDSLAPNIMRELYGEGIDTSNITLVYQSPTDVWYRDPGPIYCITPENKLAVVDFKYTNYRNVPPDSIGEKAIAHEGIDRDIAKRMNLDTINSIVAIEGGAFETNGKGVLVQVEAVTLGRNPHLSKEQIEKDFARCCGMEKVIWLPRGVADDPHNFDRIIDNIFGFATGGHTDEFVRFANDSTILLSWVAKEERYNNPINEMNYEILNTNYNILANATNTDGKKFNIIKVPHPGSKLKTVVVDQEWYDRDNWKEKFDKFNVKPKDTILWSYAKSYLNYLLTNGIVVIPQYGDINGPMNPKDRVVHELFAKLYPDRKVVGINPLFFNDGGGGMHCRFQTQPKIK